MNKKKKVLNEKLFKAKYDSGPIKSWKAKLRVSFPPICILITVGTSKKAEFI